MVTTSEKPTELVFGRYQIIRRLAVGGMGEVFLARQSGVAGFDRLVILKSLLPDLAAQDDFIEQFLDEARVAATLNHPNIVSIYEVGLWNGTYFIAMEYIRGDNLSRLQRVAERAKSKVPHDVAAFIIHDAAHALDHAHNATDLKGSPLGIVHRDVSPQNIMVRTDGVTKVVDFGIAKAANRSSRTATGLLKGKVQYMAPEQVQGKNLDGRADQFALGVVLWELLAGRKLFQGNNDIDILRDVMNAKVPLLTEVAPETPAPLVSVVQRMLGREPSMRYPSLAECAADLKKALEQMNAQSGGLKSAQENTAVFVKETLGEEISAKTVDLTPSGVNNFVINLSPPATAPTSAVMTSMAVRKQRTRIGLAAGIGVSVLMAMGAAAVIMWPEPPPPVAVVVQPDVPTPPVTTPPVATTPPPPPQKPVPRRVRETGTITKAGLRSYGPYHVATGASLTATITGSPTATLLVKKGAAPTMAAFDCRPSDKAKDRACTVAGPGEIFVAVNGAKKGASYELIVVYSEGGEVRAPMAPPRYVLDTSPPGASVELAGKVIGTTPLDTTDLAPDVMHHLTVRLDGYLDATVDVNLRAGETYRDKTINMRKPRTVKDTPPPAPPTVVMVGPPGTGKLTLSTKPWAKLYIDGKYVDSTPVSKLELSEGPHTLRLVNEAAGVDEVKKITIRSGETFKQSWTLKSSAP